MFVRRSSFFLSVPPENRLHFTSRVIALSHHQQAPHQSTATAMPGWNAGATSGNPLTTGQPNQNRGASYKVHEVQQRVDQVKGIMCASAALRALIFDSYLLFAHTCSRLPSTALLPPASPL